MKVVFNIPGLFFLSLLLLIILGSCNIRSEDCNYETLFRTSGYTYVVTKKYIDSANHGFRTLLLHNDSGYSTLILVWDTSGFYKFVKPNDTISKKRGSNYLLVDGKKKFTIYFHCKE